jgi:hypothetical protein
MARLVRHRQTKEPVTDRPCLNHRATSRLYTPELVEVREQVQGAGCMRLACVAGCVWGEAACVPGMAAGRGLIAGVRSGRFRLRRRETGPPAGKDSPRPRPGRPAQTEGLGEGTGSEEQGQNGQAIP